MPDPGPLLLTLRLAAITTAVLFILGVPLGWWLANTRSRAKPVIEAVTALPLVLPPTVIGFYLLILLSPAAPLGAAWVRVTGEQLTFSFTGLVIASVVYSLPFMVQPVQASFERIGPGPLEAAATLGARPADAFATVVLPLSARGLLTGGVISFAHTVGEFGVVLMVGGAIPGETKLVSIEIYERVEDLDYAEAHILSAILLVGAFTVLAAVYAVNRGVTRRAP